MERDRSLTTKAVPKAKAPENDLDKKTRSDSPQKSFETKQPKRMPTKPNQGLGKLTSVNTRGNPLSRKGTVGSVEGYDDDYERRLMQMLRNHNVFKDVGILEPNEQPPLKPAPEAAFKKICDDHIGGVEVSLKNSRINQRKLKKYLAKRYNLRLATKMTSIYDWVNLTEYKQFYFLVDKTILGRAKDENATPNQIIIS